MAREKTAASRNPASQRFAALSNRETSADRIAIASRAAQVNPQPVVSRSGAIVKQNRRPLQVDERCIDSAVVIESPMRDSAQISILKTGPADVAMFSKTPFRCSITAEAAADS